MQVTKKQAGKYKVVVHGLQFVLQGGFGDKSWTLWNADGTQVAKAETKSGLIQLMSYWSEEDAKQEAAAETCYYA
jgi:hypothetical protein